MRPLRLELEGFTSFRQRTCLDLSDLDLFAVTGPTGAGKSSLIDSICYALYGRVPRVANEVASCISQGMDAMQVLLEFAAGEDRYRVFRETRRKGAPNVRLDQWRDGGWRQVVDRATEVNHRVARVIGLDYEGFTRSVLLPQGQFQEFLAGSADKRRAVLRSLLRMEVYDRMRSRAGTLAGSLEGRMQGLEHELAGLADATPANLASLELELTAKQQAGRRLHAAAEALARGVEAARRVRQETDRLRQAQSALAATESDLGGTETLILEGNAALAQAEAEMKTIERDIAVNRFDPERLTALTLGRERASDLLRAEQDLSASEQARGAGRAALEDAERVAGQRLAAHGLVEAELGVADGALREAERHNLAAALQQGLHAGDPCPVCGGAVGDLPVIEAADLKQAQARLAKAKSAEVNARNAREAAATAATRAALTLETAESHAVELTARRDRQAAALVGVLPDETDRSPAAIEAALQALDAARRERQRLETEGQLLASRTERLRTQLEAGREALAALRERIVAEQEQVDAASQVREAAVQELAGLASRTAWTEVEAAIAAEGDVLALLQRRQESVQAEQRQTERDLGQMEARAERLRNDIERAECLRRDLSGLKKEHDVAADLSQMLMAHRFQAYLQAEALRTLAVDGSRRLEQLSAGRYLLTVEDKGQDFEVVDQWNGDEPRSVKTLSGGETFLASLALSLALAESLPDLAASRRVVLDSIFLDEGFGSLDPEALALASDALDALRGDGRMVCVVTHLPELAQRLPARIVVSKTESCSTAAVV